MKSEYGGKILWIFYSRLSAGDEDRAGGESNSIQNKKKFLEQYRKYERMKTGLTKQEKTTDIWFDEKDPLIDIRTHNTDLKKRLAAYAGQHPDQCRQNDVDLETGCMEFEIAKGCFSFRLTAPYSKERREAARRHARENNAADRLK